MKSAKVSLKTNFFTEKVFPVQTEIKIAEIKPYLLEKFKTNT